MKPVRLLVVLCFIAAPAQAAEIGTVTLADNGIRVLRGPTWHKLVAGVRLEDGDIVEAPDKTQMQLEFTGATLDVVGPSTFYVVPAVARDAKTNAGSSFSFDLQRGWLKATVKTSPDLRLRTPSAAF